MRMEQKDSCRKLWASVVFAALDDAIKDSRKYGNGAEQIARWAYSRDGQTVLTCAGIDPSQRVVESLVDFVREGIPTYNALAKK
ncbi:elongation factor P [Candidatus Kaiserbacteria bacterium]|nr:elongation factor P [Candidatus Kaiserbacteria bacterium]